MKNASFYIMLIVSMMALTSCIPWDEDIGRIENYRCYNSSIVRFQPGTVDKIESNYVCAVQTDKAAYDNQLNNEIQSVYLASDNTYFKPMNEHRQRTVPLQCNFLPSEDSTKMEPYSIEECGYESCPECVVLYCDTGRLVLSEKTCADYINTIKNGTFTP